ncbi:TetR/AcrR family transcriptional regulator [Saccharopolyspora erythraea]|uniref:TetR/AcrR family transcriptional regulator n=1 Tax=Saccharopolyspora erythraea TaxID=1836 RepID=UPI001BA967DF|nr:TetR/AcrR family transcriptional regulator [Saccharopolyspora erythraea]QUH02632.1 TetR/AcrR family transcriptional regulator [Saccharopolyspora erythraea]
MMSQHRNARSDLAASGEFRSANAIPEHRILDAAYELLLAIGLRRMTMADIARRAEVSRATLYRRWPNVRSVVGTLMTREWGALGTAAFEAPRTSARQGLVDGIVHIAGTIRANPMLRRIIELDPDFLLPYLLQRRGASTDQQLAMMELALREGQQDGSVRPGDVTMQARALLLTAWSFVLTGPVVAGELELPALDEQLRDMLDRYLRP